jgi:hypothetical protein
VTRRRLVASSAVAVAVLALYLASAALSGHLSPLARRPLLDGIAPPEPYRWVDPPRALSGTNQDPAAGTFQVELTPNGSKTAVLTTDDAQVTLILSKGAFAAAQGQAYVQVEITPLAPSSVSPPEAPLDIVGNVIGLDATYQPSGDRAKVSKGDARIVLVYPFITNVHAHQVVSSREGTVWRSPDTNDLPSIQQADALIDSLGYVAVASKPGPAPGVSVPDAGGGSTAATVAIVIGLVILSVAAVITLRRGRSEPGRR